MNVAGSGGLTLQQLTWKALLDISRLGGALAAVTMRLWNLVLGKKEAGQQVR